MGMNAGGFAQMSYQNSNGNYNANNSTHGNSGNGLGMPGSGFASRGKANHIKRLSVAPVGINSIHEDQVDVTPAPRTSRSHLLAGLRTAPRAGGSNGNVPASAPYTQQGFGLESSQYGQQYARNGHNSTGSLGGMNGGNNFRAAQNMPQTATAQSFNLGNYNGQNNGATQSYNAYGNQQQQHYQQQQFQQQQQQQMFSLPDQILAPPAVNFGGDETDDAVDPQYYDELMVTNYYLIQRQQQLQEQLRSVTAAAKQFQNMNINGNQQQQYNTINSGMSYYNQQMQSGMQPIVTPVPNQPGLLSVYNPMTGQQNIIMDPSYQNLSSSPPSSTPGLVNSSPDSDGPSYYRRGDNVSPAAGNGNNSGNFQPPARQNTFSPPAKSPSPPREVEPLPAPSANAFRPGHRKALSVAQANRDPLKSTGPKSAGFPATPMTGTFGPGMGRAGEHPVRQPRGPPPLEELVAAPTTKFEGSKNFATRQRRRAVLNLVKAGNERRTGRAGSADGGSPSSDVENNLHNNALSDADVESNGTLSGHSSMGNLRNSSTSTVTSAIGSEMKKKRREDGVAAAVARRSNASSFSSEDGALGESRKRLTLLGFGSAA